MTEILAAAIAVLKQGEDLLGTLSADTYTQRVPAAFNASIGGHYRHCLDHFMCLLRDLNSGQIDYDNRARDTSIEKHLEFALALTRQLQAMVENFPEELLEKTVRVRCAVMEGQDSRHETASTVGREFVYCITHAIHHYALLSVMARLQGVTLPMHLGVAPSTLAYQASIAG